MGMTRTNAIQLAAVPRAEAMAGAGQFNRLGVNRPVDAFVAGGPLSGHPSLWRTADYPAPIPPIARADRSILPTYASASDPRDTSPSRPVSEGNGMPAMAAASGSAPDIATTVRDFVLSLPKGTFPQRTRRSDWPPELGIEKLVVAALLARRVRQNFEGTGTRGDMEKQLQSILENWPDTVKKMIWVREGLLYTCKVSNRRAHCIERLWAAVLEDSPQGAAHLFFSGRGSTIYHDIVCWIDDTLRCCIAMENAVPHRVTLDPVRLDFWFPDGESVWDVIERHCKDWPPYYKAMTFLPLLDSDGDLEGLQRLCAACPADPRARIKFLDGDYSHRGRFLTDEQITRARSSADYERARRAYFAAEEEGFELRKSDRRELELADLRVQALQIDGGAPVPYRLRAVQLIGERMRTRSQATVHRDDQSALVGLINAWDHGNLGAMASVWIGDDTAVRNLPPEWPVYLPTAVRDRWMAELVEKMHTLPWADDGLADVRRGEMLAAMITGTDQKIAAWSPSSIEDARFVIESGHFQSGPVISFRDLRRVWEREGTFSSDRIDAELVRLVADALANGWFRDELLRTNGARKREAMAK